MFLNYVVNVGLWVPPHGHVFLGHILFPTLVADENLFFCTYFLLNPRDGLFLLFLVFFLWWVLLLM